MQVTGSLLVCRVVSRYAKLIVADTLRTVFSQCAEPSEGGGIKR